MRSTGFDAIWEAALPKINDGIAFLHRQEQFNRFRNTRLGNIVPRWYLNWYYRVYVEKGYLIPRLQIKIGLVWK